MLQLGGVDFLTIVENYEFDRTGLDACWIRHGNDASTAVDEIQFLIGLVHGPCIERDFLTIYHEVRNLHESELDTVVAVLSTCYGYYPNWAKGVSVLQELRASMPIDWDEVLQRNV